MPCNIISTNTEVLNIQKTKIMASGPITSWQIDGETSIWGCKESDTTEPLNNSNTEVSTNYLGAY